MALSDEDLIQILRREEQEASDWNDSELSAHRLSALKYYNREARGDEQEGQSKVVTSEFSDVIESFMPSLMRVFASGEEVAEFAPMSPGDEQWAKQATQYVPHVFMRENDGFRVLYWALKSALMDRLSAATVDTEEKSYSRTDPIKSWTGEQLAAAHEAATAAGATEVKIEVQPDPAPQATDIDPATGAPIPAVETFSGSITLTRTKKCVVVDNIAPEDILITKARDIDEASFAGYRKEVTASDLRKLGVKQDEIDELSTDRPTTVEQDQRDDGNFNRDVRKDSEKRFWLVLAYVKADDNGDGISETIRCLYAHAGGQASRIIERMEWEDGETPMATASPILMPHTMVGRSLFDQVQDLQDVGTALTRGLLDNVYHTNRPRLGINGRVNINQVLDWTPGMPIQVQGNDNPMASIGAIQIPSIIGPAQAALEYFATVRENRTGVTRYNQGLDANSLNKTASGINMVMTAAQQRQELIARTFAETFVKRLMRLVYRAIKRNATGPVEYFNGEEWAECDPSQWPDDMHLVVNVALGTGNKQQEMQNLMLIGAAQEKLVLAQGGPDGPLVKPEHMANTARKLVEAAGFKSAAQFVASQKDIQNAPPKPPQESPEMAKVKAETAAKQQQMQTDFVLEQQKQANQIVLAREKHVADMEMLRQKNEMEFAHKQRMLAADYDLKVKEMGLEAVLEKYRIDNEPKQPPANVREQQVSA